jgi:hypothetical protein
MGSRGVFGMSIDIFAITDAVSLSFRHGMVTFKHSGENSGDV